MTANMRRLSLSLSLLWVALGSGCATTGDTQAPVAVAQAADAEDLMNRGEFHAAADAFLVLAKDNSSSRGHYRLRAAEALREEGDLAGATQALDGVKRKRLSPEEGVRLDLIEAEIALSQKDPARALTLLTVPEANLPANLVARRLELTARAEAGSGDGFAAARTRAQLNRSLRGTDRDQNEQQLVAALAGANADQLKERAAQLAQNDALRPWLEQALRKQGQALPLLVLHPNRPVGTLQPANGNSWAKEGFRPLHRIALLLPASGPLKAAAAAIRDGFFVAFFNDRTGGEARPEIRIYDSGTTTDEALAAYQKAVNDGADHAVGPLTREAVGALFDLGTLPIPVLALNQADSGATPPPGSLAFGLLPDVEGAQVAEHMHDLGLKDAAIIAAGDDWAERAALAFRAQFESLGGQVVGEARIKDNEVNYSTAIRRAAGTFANATGAGVFISMRPQQARLLMPQMKLANLNLPVFASSHVYAGTSNPGQDRDLDGIEFCDAPWLFDVSAGLPRHDEMSRSLDSARGAGGRLFALGLDAYSLLPYLDWLGTHPDNYLPGATGQLAADNFGRVHRLMTWARFDGGVAHPVSGLSLSTAPTQ